MSAEICFWVLPICKRSTALREENLNSEVLSIHNYIPMYIRSLLQANFETVVLYIHILFK